MAKDTELIYQLKITLNHIRPPVWRRLLTLASVSLTDLHDFIQGIMPWDDSHLFLFQKGRKIFSEHDPFNPGSTDIDSSEVSLAEVLTAPKQELSYVYDFGDSWEHTIVLERILPYDPESIYPLCVGGERACPPEDCGGPPGYADMLAALKNPNHPEHELYLDWIGDDFDPEAFDIGEANDALLFDLFEDDSSDPPLMPVNRHLVVLEPSQAYFDLVARVRGEKADDAPGQEDLTPLAFMVPITPSREDLESNLDSLMPMFTAMQMLMETFDLEVISELPEEEFANLFTLKIIPLVFDLDWQSPLVHLTPDLLGDGFEEDEL
jgi:hypothetical protein